MKKIISILLFLILSINILKAQCSISFNAFPDPPNGTVFDYVGVSGIVSSVTWDFGNGDTLVEAVYGGAIGTTIHPYSTNGTYYVCLTLIDSTLNQFGNPTGGISCVDTFCDSVSVTSAGSWCNSTASISYIDNGNGNFTFYSSLVGANVYNGWNFGDGSGGQGDTVNHTYIANSTFAVSLGVNDYSVVPCSYGDTAVVNVTGVINPLQCLAGFVSIYDSLFNGVYVINNSIGNNLTYFWDFGDGNTSNQQFPNYTYSTTGPFWLCLTIDDGNGCIDTYCDSIGLNGMVLKQSGFTIQVTSSLITSFENQIEQDLNFIIYPNPAKDSFTSLSLFDIANNNYNINVYDLLGKLVFTKAIKSKKQLFDTSELKKGIYFCNFTKDNIVIKTEKLIIR
jgi:hypothetical protein